MNNLNKPNVLVFKEGLQKSNAIATMTLMQSYTGYWYNIELDRNKFILVYLIINLNLYETTLNQKNYLKQINEIH